jgi:hypothetical protein
MSVRCYVRSLKPDRRDAPSYRSRLPCSWRIRGLLDRAPRALPSCWRRHLPPTTSAWLPMSESGCLVARTLGGWGCCFFYEQAHRWTSACDCFWAKAVVWRLAVFASCPRSEPVVSKRSGSRPTSASACWNAPCQLTRRGVRSCNPGRSGSLVGADSQAAEIPQLCSDATKTAARAEQCDSLGGFEWVVAGCWI